MSSQGEFPVRVPRGKVPVTYISFINRQVPQYNRHLLPL